MCIETFPSLEEIYEEYSDAGFEIVSVSIDSERENWEKAIDDYKTPWINL